jgi:hypothetical protein
LAGVSCNILIVAYGTFVRYSWDVMEPIAYFIASGSSILMSVYFLATRRSFSWHHFLAGTPRKKQLARLEEGYRQAMMRLMRGG